MEQKPWSKPPSSNAQISFPSVLPAFMEMLPREGACSEVCTCETECAFTSSPRTVVDTRYPLGNATKLLPTFSLLNDRNRFKRFHIDLTTMRSSLTTSSCPPSPSFHITPRLLLLVCVLKNPEREMFKRC